MGQQPVVGVGAVIVHAGRVVLIQRGKEPLRGRWLVRWFRLAGRARMPTTVEMDVTPPAGLAP